MHHHQTKRKSRIIALILSLFLLPGGVLGWGNSPAWADTAKHYTDLSFSPVAEVRVPSYSRFQLANGMTVYLMEDHDWPLVGGTLLVRTGDRLEPENKVGLAEVMGEVLRTGGTAKHSPEQINQFLEQRAAAIEAGIGKSSGSIGFSALKEDLESVFDLFCEVVQEPVFAQEKIDLAKIQRRGEIARRNDNPETISSREFDKLIYGQSSPYARTIDYTTLEAIQFEDVQAFYRQYFKPSQMLLGIVGDFDSLQLRSRIEAKFGQWKSDQPPTDIPKLPAVKAVESRGIYVVDQPQLTQSYVQFGQLGGQLSDPNVFALFVLNGVMNGLGGRLVNQVRSQQGLAYSVYALWQPQFDYPGVFVAGGQTRSEATVPFIQSIQAELEKLQSTPISPAELAVAKDAILNSFVFNFQTPSQTLSRLMRYDYFGYPADFLFQYQRGVKAVTVADVQRVAKAYLHPDQMATLVVGNQRAIQPPLTRLSKHVSAIDITIPQPAGAS
jgi:zinc protease